MLTILLLSFAIDLPNTEFSLTINLNAEQIARANTTLNFVCVSDFVLCSRLPRRRVDAAKHISLHAVSLLSRIFDSANRTRTNTISAGAPHRPDTAIDTTLPCCAVPS